MEKNRIYFLSILLFLSLNNSLIRGAECNLKDLGFKGVEYKGEPITDDKIRQRVENALCEAIKKIDNCAFLTNEEKSKINKNKGRYFFTIVFDSNVTCGGIDKYKFFKIGIFLSKAYMTSDVSGLCSCDLTSTLLHELIHFWYPLNGSDLDECKVSKIEQQCYCPTLDWEAENQDHNCDTNKDFEKWVKDHDNPDDNYSFSAGISFTESGDISAFGETTEENADFTSFTYPVDIVLLNKYKMEQKEQLLQKMVGDEYFSDETPDDFLNEHIVLMIPTGELAGEENSNLNREALKRFVVNGGTLIVLAQQYGTHYEKIVPLPEGSSLSALGWREDQSCFWGSAYHKTLNNVPHPIFSGVGSETVSVGVDGYFSIVPTEATVLLRRKLNQEPVMISYPFGEGTVILTSLFSDFANAHSQMSGVDEAHIIRDLLTYARNVKRDIPSWRLTNNQAMSISLPEVDVRNDGEVSAARAKFRVLSPDRKRVLYTVEQAIAIEPQATANAALEFSITPTGLYDNIVRQWLGIYHVEVELYDAAGNYIQTAGMNDSEHLVA